MIMTNRYTFRKGVILMSGIFKKAFWVPYDESDTYPTVAKAHEAISGYCEENGYSYSFNGDDEVVINDQLHEISTAPPFLSCNPFPQICDRFQRPCFSPPIWYICVMR